METWIVKSKTGKMYPCISKEQAMALAKDKSTKTSVFVVYNNGKAVAAFVNKKQLPDTVTLGTWYKEEMSSEAKQTLYHSYCGSKTKVVHEGAYVYILEKTNDRIKIKICNKCLILTKDKKHVCRFKTYSVTFAKDGRVYFYDGKLHFNTAPCWNIPEHAMRMLCYQIGKMRPELASVMKIISAHNKNPNLNTLVKVFTRPAMFFSIDPFKGTANPRMYYNKLSFDKFPRGVITDDKLVEILAKQNSVPCSKQLKKLYMLDLRNILVVKNLIQCGITDINYISRLSDLGISLCDSWYNEYRFVELVFNIRGIQSAMYMFENYHTNRNILSDCCRMRDYVDNETFNWIVKNAKNIDEIHDTLVEQSRKHRQKRNITFDYTEKEKTRFNHSYDNIKFELAVDSRDLAVVGATMGICVGSYASSVANKHSTIVKMTQGDKYVACIEIQGNSMVQLKAKYNNPVKAQYKTVIDKWLEDAKLIPVTKDYRDIGKTWNNDHNYAAVNPHDYDENPVELRIVKNIWRPEEPIKRWYGLTEYERKLAIEEFNKQSEAEEETWYAEVAARYATA